MKFTQLFGDFTHISFNTIEIMHIHFNFNKRDYQCSHKRRLIVAKKVALYALLVCKIFGPKIRSCKIFDKFQVWVRLCVDRVDKVDKVGKDKGEEVFIVN